MVIAVTVFLAISSLIILIAVLAGGREDPLEARLSGTSGGSGSGNFDDRDPFRDAAPSFKLTNLLSGLLTPTRGEGRQKLGDRLIQAGLYKRGSLPSYIVTRTLFIIAPMAIGFGTHVLGLLTLSQGLVAGVAAGLAGTIAPGFWLDYHRKKRQTNIRRALPDALDIIVVCVEGGLSLPAAFAKVSSELQTAHPMLASEMLIVQREIQMGRSTGEALKNFANRFDLEELRGLASVVLQAEKFGASIIKALRVHADSLREKRQLRAEELAAQAAVKLLIPTLLCIFPALFVVILGPAAFDLYELFSEMNNR
jgi:tight adherence protein C